MPHCVPLSLTISLSIHLSLCPLMCLPFFLCLPFSTFVSSCPPFTSCPFAFPFLCLWLSCSVFDTFSLSLCWPDRYIQMEVKDSVMHYSNPSQEQEFGTMTGKLPLKQAICWDNKPSVKQVRGETIQESSWHDHKWDRIIFSHRAVFF